MLRAGKLGHVEFTCSYYNFFHEMLNKWWLNSWMADWTDIVMNRNLSGYVPSNKREKSKKTAVMQHEEEKDAEEEVDGACCKIESNKQ